MLKLVTKCQIVQNDKPYCTGKISDSPNWEGMVWTLRASKYDSDGLSL